MSSLRFQDLKVYQLAEELADAVWAIVEKWGNFARDTVGKQLVRAADSIGANIAEGSGKGTFNDNRRFVRIARARSTRHNTGFAVPSAANCSQRNKFRNSKLSLRSSVQS
jgi:four helix bundle protein